MADLMRESLLPPSRIQPASRRPSSTRGVIGYHMPFPSLGYIERAGTRWLPHTYRLNA